MSPAGEHLHLVGDPGPGGIDQVKDRHTQPLCHLLDPNDLFHGAGSPGSGLHGGIVGHDADRTALDLSDHGDHAVGAISWLIAVRQQSVFHKEVRIEEELQPASHRELVFLPQLLGVFRRTAGPGGVRACLQIVARRLLLGVRGTHAETVPVADA